MYRNITVQDHPHMPGTLIVAGPCRYCHEHVQIDVPWLGFEEWKQGALIQNAMPSLDTESREFLISGVCGTCWDQMFTPVLD